MYIATQHCSQVSKTGKYNLPRDEKRRTRGLALSRSTSAQQRLLRITIFPPSRIMSFRSKSALDFKAAALGAHFSSEFSLR
jgi:hypothetical protein